MEIGGGSACGDSAGNDEQVPWPRRVQSAIKKSRSIRGGNYVQLATVDSDGAPHCRTVVFRGFLPGDGGLEALKMITDARSEKVLHARASPACEMVWWFSQSSEQYRISGELQLVGPEADGTMQAAREEQWSKLSGAAREQFWWNDPGLPFTGTPIVPKEGCKDGQMLPPPGAFILLLLWPRTVKYLNLRSNLAIEDTWDAGAGVWRCQRVNP